MAGVRRVTSALSNSKSFTAGSALTQRNSPLRKLVVALLAVLFVVLCREVFSSSKTGTTNIENNQVTPKSHHVTAHYTRRSKSCPRKRYLGDTYGGWMICEPDSPDGLRGALVYTIGVGRNIEWDKAMIREYGTVHHGWDPTPRAVDFVRTTKMPENFHFHKFGLGTKDGRVTATLPVGNTDSYTISSYKHAHAQRGKATEIPVLSLESMMNLEKHEQLAILKIDIEGAEFNVIRTWAENNYQLRADQVLIEFHERYFNFDKSLVSRAVTQMRQLGFVVFHRAKLEISFVRIK